MATLLEFRRVLLRSCRCFFFQAEDGIRDGHVTGVQTCALPIYIAVVEGFILRGDRVQGRGWIGVLLGMAGLVLLLWPKLENPTLLGRMQLIACLVVICGSFSWACGSILSRRSKISVDPMVATGWEMTFAGVVNLVLAAAF